MLRIYSEFELNVHSGNSELFSLYSFLRGISFKQNYRKYSSRRESRRVSIREIANSVCKKWTEAERAIQERFAGSSRRVVYRFMHTVTRAQEMYSEVA